MIIESENDQLTRLLCLGSWPAQVDSYNESADILKQLIYYDYQLYKIINTDLKENSLIPTEHNSNRGITDLILQLESLNNKIITSEIVLSIEETDYLYTILSHLQYLNSNFKESEKLSTLLTFPTNAAGVTQFLIYLNVRFQVVLACTFHQLNYIDEALLVNYNTLSATHYPNASNILANIWLENLYHRLSLIIIRPRFSTLQENINNKLTLISFSSYLLNNNLVDEEFIELFYKFIVSFEGHLMNNYEFPNAKEFNYELEELINTLVNCWKKFNIKLDINWLHQLILKSLKKTYQSHIIMKQLINVLVNLGKFDEALAAFHVYIDYIQAEEVQTGSIKDIISVLVTISKVLLVLTPNKISINYSKKNNELKNDLKHFAQLLESYLFKVSSMCQISYDTNPEDHLSFLYSRSKANDRLAKILSKSWFSLGNLCIYLSRISPDEPSLFYYLKESNKYHKNCLYLNFYNNKYLFNYALLLAYSRKISESTKLLKLHLKTYPNNYQSWNLLSLLLSINENKTDCEKIINNAINLSNAYLQELTNLDHLSINIKHSIIQLKLTQLSILETCYGLEQAIEMLPEVFTLFSQLFSNIMENNNNDKYNPDDQAMEQHNISSSANKWSHRPSFVDPSNKVSFKEPVRAGNARSSSTKLMKTLSLTRNSADPHSETVNGHRKKDSINSLNSKYKFKKNVTSERKVLQECWLFASSLYLRAGQFLEAEEAIVEAETVYVPTVSTHAQLGLLAASQRKFLSLQEFEISLEHDETHVKAILGLSNIFLHDSSDSSLFISEKDKLAGLARVKNYLELLSSNFKGYNNSEVWWLLSKIYEFFDDKINLRKSLWKCVELEDLRPARDFSVCEDFQ